MGCVCVLLLIMVPFSMATQDSTDLNKELYRAVLKMTTEMHNVKDKLREMTMKMNSLKAGCDPSQPCPPGLQGKAGPKGDEGEKGRNGLKGDLGRSGPKGDAGLNGSSGHKGEAGPQGLTGQKGSKGQGQQRPRVAFMGTRSTDMTSGGTITYDQEVIDTSGGFNPHTGVFVARQPGVYQFTFHGALWSFNKTATMQLRHNGNTVCATYAYMKLSGSSIGNSAIISLRQNDHVYVYMSQFQHIDSGSSNYITFTGVLLF